MELRELTENELLDVAGGQTPTANVRVNLPAGGCGPVQVGNHTQEVCDTSAQSTMQVLNT